MSGIALQKDNLFTGSIADNISFFDPEATATRIEAAARLAHIHDDIVTIAATTTVVRTAHSTFLALVWRTEMNVLDHEAIQNVSGGNPVVLWAVLTTVVVAAGALEDFANGFADGVSDHNEKR